MGGNEIFYQRYFLLQNETYSLLFWRKRNTKLWKCSYCLTSKTGTSDREYKKIIFEALMRSPMTLDELAVHLKFYPKDELLEHLKILLDRGQVRMLNYKTYTL